jgi:hypothetical protein
MIDPPYLRGGAPRVTPSPVGYVTLRGDTPVGFSLQTPGTRQAPDDT